MGPLSILVVDDVEDFAQLLCDNLRHLGHTAAYATNGRGAKTVLAGNLFDAVVTDIVMPSGDGFEIIDETKKLQPKAKIIAMSGGGPLYKADACLQAAEQNGADAILEKPFTTQTLVETLQRLFP